MEVVFRSSCRDVLVVQLLCLCLCVLSSPTQKAHTQKQPPFLFRVDD
jgi:hypothetical protein